MSSESADENAEAEAEAAKHAEKKEEDNENLFFNIKEQLMYVLDYNIKKLKEKKLKKKNKECADIKKECADIEKECADIEKECADIEKECANIEYRCVGFAQAKDSDKRKLRAYTYNLIDVVCLTHGIIDSSVSLNLLNQRNLPNIGNVTQILSTELNTCAEIQVDDQLDLLDKLPSISHIEDNVEYIKELNTLEITQPTYAQVIDETSGKKITILIKPGQIDPNELIYKTPYIPVKKYLVNAYEYIPLVELIEMIKNPDIFPGLSDFTDELIKLKKFFGDRATISYILKNSIYIYMKTGARIDLVATESDNTDLFYKDANNNLITDTTRILSYINIHIELLRYTLKADVRITDFTCNIFKDEVSVEDAMQLSAELKRFRHLPPTSLLLPSSSALPPTSLLLPSSSAFPPAPPSSSSKKGGKRKNKKTCKKPKKSCRKTKKHKLSAYASVATAAAAKATAGF